MTNLLNVMLSDGEAPAAPAADAPFLTSGLLLGDARRRSRLDADGAGLLFLRDLALQLDRQKAVRQAGPHHLHMVGELETALEFAGRDAAIEVFLLLGRRLRRAGDQKL